MQSKHQPLLEKLAAHSALFALLFMILSELVGFLLRRLPAPLRPANAWVHSEGAFDLDDRRTWDCKAQNRRVARRDRRRNMGIAPRGFSAFARSDRRATARGRRTSDWRCS